MHHSHVELQTMQISADSLMHKSMPLSGD